MTFNVKRLRSVLIHPRRFLKYILLFAGLISLLVLASFFFYIHQLYQSIPSQESIQFESVSSHAELIMATKPDTAVSSTRTNAPSSDKQETIALDNSNASNTEKNSIISENTLKDAPSYPWVELKNINTDLIHAIILSEDPDFFNHKGINYDEFMYSLESLVNGNKKTNSLDESWNLGIGTISQQTATKLYLSSDHFSVFSFSKPLTLKIQELITTQRLEDHLSKKEILELYLNVMDFGPNLFGVSNASRYYFNKEASDVDAAESVYLALLMPSSKNYHYTLFQKGNWSPALKKKHQNILRQMYHLNLISNEDYRKHSNWLYRRSDYYKE